jgi:hypothetical protein
MVKEKELRDCKTNKESNAIKKFLKSKVEITVSASIIAKYLVVTEEAEGGKLLVKDICILGI